MKKSNKLLIIILLLFLIIISIITYFIINSRIKEKEMNLKKQEEERILISNITNNYNPLVYTTKETDLYIKEDNQYIKKGKINSDVKLLLEELKEITIENEYLKIINIDKDYYIHYSDIKNIEKEEDTSNTNINSLNLRYKNYIPFNENIITKEEYSLYDLNDNFLYQLNVKLDKPIIIKKSDKYYFEYYDKLVYIKKEDVEKIEERENTLITPTSNMPVLAYHFFYDETNNLEVKECGRQIISISEQNFAKHLDYLKDNGFFTPNMIEFEMFIDGELRLDDKTVLITIDDGWYADGGVRLLTEYGFNGTLFLITSAYDPNAYITDYVEVHSHSDGLHENYKCSGGNQGGALLCYNEDVILNDLKTSKDKLFGSNVFCYPFYDYNNRAINLLNEAGYTLAFIGGYKKAVVGQNKMLIPRYTILGSDSVNVIANIIN